MQHNIGTRRSEMHAFFGGGTSGFWGGQVVLVIHLSVGQVDFFTKFEPRNSNTSLFINLTSRAIIRHAPLSALGEPFVGSIQWAFSNKSNKLAHAITND